MAGWRVTPGKRSKSSPGNSADLDRADELRCDSKLKVWLIVSWVGIVNKQDTGGHILPRRSRFLQQDFPLCLFEGQL